MPVSIPKPMAGTTKAAAGGAMPQAGRSRPLTSRSVSTKISPITDTKMILTPASASIGAAWVCMCCRPCCHSST